MLMDSGTSSVAHPWTKPVVQIPCHDFMAKKHCATIRYVFGCKGARTEVEHYRGKMHNCGASPPLWNCGKSR
jgi:hypothetical protein